MTNYNTINLTYQQQYLGSTAGHVQAWPGQAGHKKCLPSLLDFTTKLVNTNHIDTREDFCYGYPKPKR